MNIITKQELIKQIQAKTLPEHVVISKTKYSVYKEICGLANTKGGIIVIGISENYELEGVKEPEKVIDEIENKCKIISKKLVINFTKINIKGFTLILVEVDELDYTLKLLKYNGKPYLIRNGEAVYTTQLERRYYEFVNSTSTYDELAKNSNYEISMIDQDFEDKFYDKVRKLSANELSKTQMKKFFRLKKSGFYMTLCRNMCFGINPQAYYPNYDILIYDLRGDEKLIARITGKIYSMFKETIYFLKDYLGMSLYINDKKEIVRKEAYPVVVLEEAIYNALVHRDYSKFSIGSSIIIKIKEDSISITNPACFLYEGSQKENNIKIPRNESIKKINDILLDIPLENRGISSIYNNMKKCGYIEPQVFYENGIYEVTLYNKTIYDFYKGDITIKRICEFCMIPRSREEIYLHFKPNGKSSPYHFIRKYISPLIESGILKYKIIEHKNSRNQKIYTNF